MPGFIRRPSDLDGRTVEKVLKRASFFLTNHFAITDNSLKESVDRSSQPTRSRVIFLAFFEPSTRTRVSFDMAANLLGVRTVVMGAEGDTSQTKGESVFETLKTLQMMQPDLLVVRSREPIEEVWPNSEVPYLNAGDGTRHHPTQAFGDLMTLRQEWTDLRGKKVLFLGDIAHSRVANSNRELLGTMGVEFGFSGPEFWRPRSNEWSATPVVEFAKLREALEWADVVMMHRAQTERHERENPVNLALFQLNAETIRHVRPEARLMHPGPFNLGRELTQEVIADPRSLIHRQVRNSVPMRMAILEHLLEGAL